MGGLRYSLGFAVGAVMVWASYKGFTGDAVGVMDKNVFPGVYALAALLLLLPTRSAQAAPVAAAPRPAAPTKSGDLPEYFKARAGVEAPANAVGLAKLNRLTRLLAGSVGPMAKVQVKQAVEGLGATVDTIEREQYDDLIAALAEKLAEGAPRESFVKQAGSLGK